MEKLSKDEILKTIITSIQKTDLKKSTKKVKGVEINDAKIRILSPLVVGRKGEYYQMLYDLLGKGVGTVVVDGKEYSLRERIQLDKNKNCI